MKSEFYTELREKIEIWAKDLGFQQLGVTDTNLEEDEKRLRAWLAEGRHGEMHYMASHGTRRSRPAELIPGTLRIISTRMNYLPRDTLPEEVLTSPEIAYISRYALGRDYHKVIRSRLSKLWQKIAACVEEQGETGYSGRVFTDSAPVLEKGLAQKAGLGWIGKNTLLLNRTAGSWFFLGEIYTNLPLPTDDQPGSNLCGSCSACIDVCPTAAIVAPYELDARRCISYLTIEQKGAIPENFRRAIGNRIFGCDDCQLVCPWNKFARVTTIEDFEPRLGLSSATLLSLLNWTEAEFLEKTRGSAIRRAGFQGWQRNIAIALGNGPADREVVRTLTDLRPLVSDMVAEHINWAISELAARAQDKLKK
ncbi:MAG: tRNA epoxyqueuosine(34) reductase QueG [Pseudomonadota bacterium]